MLYIGFAGLAFAIMSMIFCGLLAVAIAILEFSDWRHDRTAEQRLTAWLAEDRQVELLDDMWELS